MEQNSDDDLMLKFDAYRAKSEIIKEKKNLFGTLFSFGVHSGSTHDAATPELQKSNLAMIVIHDDLREQWNPKDIIRIKFGHDDDGQSDEDCDGMVHWEYGIRRAGEFSRPEWSFFYYAGYLEGMVNSDAEDTEEFIRCLKLFPLQFLEMHGNKIEELYNYFDEKRLVLHIEIVNGTVEVRFDNKPSN